MTRLTPRLLLAFSALCLAAGSAVHTQAYPTAAAVADHSTLPPLFASCFKGLWLCDSVNALAFALIFASIALYPRIAAPPLVMLLACAPLGVAVALFATMGNFFPGYVMLAAGAATFVAGFFLRPRRAQPQ